MWELYKSFITKIDLYGFKGCTFTSDYFIHLNTLVKFYDYHLSKLVR